MTNATGAPHAYKKIVFGRRNRNISQKTKPYNRFISIETRSKCYKKCLGEEEEEEEEDEEKQNQKLNQKKHKKHKKHKKLNVTRKKKTNISPPPAAATASQPENFFLKLAQKMLGY
jgi:hypothetical protein